MAYAQQPEEVERLVREVPQALADLDPRALRGRGPSNCRSRGKGSAIAK